MKTVAIIVHGREEKVIALRFQHQLWVHFDGRTFVYNGAEKLGLSKGQAIEDDPVILAPMPGKVTSVLVSEGDAVCSGDVLVVMEAMKMEYTLAAKIDGTVQTVSCNVGGQVRLGETLIVLEPKK